MYVLLYGQTKLADHFEYFCTNSIHRWSCCGVWLMMVNPDPVYEIFLITDVFFV